MKRLFFKKGFTLSEVLVTITIIGVIAAISIPILSNKYKTAEVESRLKKVFSTLSQASMTARAVGYEWDQWAGVDKGQVNWSNTDDVVYFYNNYLRPYVSTLSVEEKGSNVHARFADGTKLTLGKGSCMMLYADINGDKGPNKDASDRFYFLYCGKVMTDRPNSKIIPYGLMNDTTLESALKNCKSNTAMCSTPIMLNGWKVPKDYPHKI